MVARQLDPCATLEYGLIATCCANVMQDGMGSGVWWTFALGVRLVQPEHRVSTVVGVELNSWLRVHRQAK